MSARKFQECADCTSAWCAVHKECVNAPSQFKRENRYIVIKRKHLVADQESRIHDLLEELGVLTVECVVVESDWPEYETIWKMIEARVTGASAASPELAERAKSGQQ